LGAYVVGLLDLAVSSPQFLQWHKEMRKPQEHILGFVVNLGADRCPPLFCLPSMPAVLFSIFMYFISTYFLPIDVVSG
jgi:hypothetical protein